MVYEFGKRVWSLCGWFMSLGMRPGVMALGKGLFYTSGVQDVSKCITSLLESVLSWQKQA